MDSRKLHDWLEIAGITAVVASLIFVGLQLKQSSDIALGETFESAAARGVELRALVAEHSVTWQKACLGEQLTDPEKLIAGSIFFNYAQNAFNSWARFERTGFGGGGNQFYVDAYAANIHRYPGFRDMAISWRERGEHGARFEGELIAEFGAAIRQRLDELQQTEPNPSADVMWCGIR
jgi:hypothetical protein